MLENDTLDTNINHGVTFIPMLTHEISAIIHVNGLSVLSYNHHPRHPANDIGRSRPVITHMATSDVTLKHTFIRCNTQTKQSWGPRRVCLTLVVRPYCIKVVSPSHRVSRQVFPSYHQQHQQKLQFDLFFFSCWYSS